MTFFRVAVVCGGAIALLFAVYATFQLGANQQSEATVDTSHVSALRKGDMKKLIFASQPQNVVTLPFLDENQSIKFFTDYNGKYLLVNFWATWCAPCRKEMPSLNKLQTTFGGDNFKVITIATGHNPIPAIKNFFKKEDITELPILLDPKQDLVKKMSIFGLPSTIILDPNGREIARLRGDAEWADENAFVIIKALITTEHN